MSGIPWSERFAYGIGNHVDYGNSVTLDITANTNNLDWNLGNIRPHLIILNPDANWNLTGLIAPEGDEPIMVGLFNPTSFDVQLIHEGTNSEAANRLALQDNGSITVGPNYLIDLVYFPTYGRWYFHW